MADFHTTDSSAGSGQSSLQHSRQGSLSSGHSLGDKENHECSPLRSYSSLSSNGRHQPGDRELILLRGGELMEESVTETNHGMTNGHISAPKSGRQSNDHLSSQTVSGGTAKARAAKSPYSAGPISSIPESEFSIPPSGNISEFSCDQMAGLLRCLRVDDRIITHLHRKQVDGKRFARLKDSELESLNMKNPVVLFFREKSEPKKGKSKGQWRL